MPTLMQVIDAHTVLGRDDRAWLTHLVDEWSMLADLSFSDLILWVPDSDDNIFWAAAQVRPTTGPTSLEDDVVGEDIAYDAEHLVTEAYLSHEISHTSTNSLNSGIPVDVTAIPIVDGTRVIGVVEMHTNRMGTRAPGALEDAYLDAAEILAGMVMRREFPIDHGNHVRWLSPRVGDGLIRVDKAGTIVFASPNAMSAYRRMGLTGDLVGEKFQALTCSLIGQCRTPVETSFSTVLSGKRSAEVDLETPTATVRMRVLRLTTEDGPVGLLGMCRDTTELRSQERQLVTKDATIHEIHHRVKNNLQTVASVLRLQARRIRSEEAKEALGDAMKRVQAIAVVHEILSQEFDSTVKFDEVADRLLKMVGDVATTGGMARMIRVGSFGYVPADVATNLSLVLTELCQNAVEHGFGSGSGEVIVSPSQSEGQLTVTVYNGGEPLPADFAIGNSTSLGLSIVRTLVEDLKGTFTLHPGPGDRGTIATVTVPLV